MLGARPESSTSLVSRDSPTFLYVKKVSKSVVRDKIGSGDLLNFVWASDDVIDEVTKAGADVRAPDLISAFFDGESLAEFGEMNELE